MTDTNPQVVDSSDSNKAAAILVAYVFLVLALTVFAAMQYTERKHAKLHPEMTQKVN